jgi:pimeloyl-ACP methyl ester carboxylesterase
MEHTMNRAILDGGRVELAYRLRGAGEPLVFVHGGVLADGFHPLFVAPQLAEDHLLILYHRRGYGESSRVEAPFTSAQQAADGLALVRHLGLSRVSIVGHSYGAAIALQWALDAPDSVQSLVLLEPPLFHEVAAGADFWSFIASLTETYERGDEQGAMDTLLRGVVGPDYRQGIERSLPPGALEAAAADLASLFRVELPALRSWRFSEEDARSVHQPVLLVAGTEAGEVFRQSHALYREWLARAEELIVPTTHGLHYEEPQAVARGIAEFLARHGRRPTTPATE